MSAHGRASVIICMPHAPPLPARLAWKVIHFIPRDKWSHRLLAPFRRQTESCVKEIHFGTFNKTLRWGPVDVCHLICLSAEEPLRLPRHFVQVGENCHPHHVVKICSFPFFFYHLQSLQYRLQGCGRYHAALLSAKWRVLLLVFQFRCVLRARIYHLTPWKCCGCNLVKHLW